MDDLPKTTVTRPEFLPVPDRECKTVCVANMTREERDVYRQGITCPLISKQLKDCEESQFYQHCKRDICKEMRDCKEHEEKDKAERLDALTKRNQILEEHARQQEVKQKKMEKDIEKMASLVAQLMNK